MSSRRKKLLDDVQVLQQQAQDPEYFIKGKFELIINQIGPLINQSDLSPSCGEKELFFPPTYCLIILYQSILLLEEGNLILRIIHSHSLLCLLFIASTSLDVRLEDETLYFSYDNHSGSMVQKHSFIVHLTDYPGNDTIIRYNIQYK